MFFVLVLSITLSVYCQGLYWESTMSGSALGDKTVISKFFSMPKKFKTLTTDENSEAVIVRLDKELLMMVNSKEKTYSEMTFAEMEGTLKKAGSQMDEKMAEMQKQLENLPEEQRKMVEQMMGDKMQGKKKETPVNVKNTGEKKSINGYSCTKYVVSQDNKEVMTMWVTKDIKEFGAMRKDWEEFSKRMSSLNPMQSTSLIEGIKKIDGFPIETDIAQGIKTVVTKIEKRSTPASEFEVPSGFKKVKPTMMEEIPDKLKHKEKDENDNE
jgi:GLPGLI family protein